MAFEDRENTSLTYDSKKRAYVDSQISDADGRLLKSINIGTFDLSPALAVPSTELILSGSEIMQTGDSCVITRDFIDETGPRWDFAGTRSIVGTPFKVLDTDETLDCSNWPAGIYTVTETYQNGLGQTTSDTLELVIVNKPPPLFTIAVEGSDALAGTPCTITQRQLVKTTILTSKTGQLRLRLVWLPILVTLIAQSGNPEFTKFFSQ